MKKITKLDKVGMETEIFYDSITEVIKDISEYKKLPMEVKEKFLLDFRKYHSNFHYFQSFDEAVDALTKGNWQTGIEQLNVSFAAEAKTLEERTRRRNFYDVCGYQASVPRYLQGLPTNMINNKPMKKPEKTLTIVKHIGFLVDVTAGEILKNSAKALAILNRMEKMGIRCNLDILSPATYDLKTGVIRIRIKNASERLSVGKLAFPLANPDMLRRIVFCLRQYNTYTGKWDVFPVGRYGIGSTIYDISKNTDNLEKAGVSNCIFLNNFIKDADEELKRNGLIK